MALIATLVFGTEVATAAETFHLSFDKSLNADEAAGAAAPIKTEKVRLVPGLRGQGAAIPLDGVLDYLAKSNIAAGAGAISFWVKLSWTPTGIGHWPDNAMPGERRKTACSLFAVDGPLRASLGTTLYFPKNASFNYYRTPKQIFRETWTHFAFSWNKDSAKIYMNGEFINGGKSAFSQDGKTLSFGLADTANSGLSGVLDEVCVFDTALADNDIQALYAAQFPVAVAPLDYAGLAGTESAFRLRFVNLTPKKQEKHFSLTVIDLVDSSRALKKDFDIKAAAGATVMESFSFVPEAKDYLVGVQADGLSMKTYEITAISSVSVAAEMPSSPTGEVEMKLLEEIDCTKDYPAEKYRDDGACRVARSPAGDYRETSLAGGNSGFAYRLKINKPGTPHWIEIEYPDDADRVFFVAVYPYSQVYQRVVSTGSLDTIGVITGGNHPLTFRPQTKRLLFWPDSEEFMLCCYSFLMDKGVALSKIRLYEPLGPLPKLEINYPDTAPRRSFGIWEEDPTMLACNWFNRPENWKESCYDFWKIKSDRITQYMKLSGKNFWSLEVVDYDGDNTGSMTYLLPPSPTTSSVGRIPGYADVMARVFDREHIPFYVELHWLTRDWSVFWKLLGAESVSVDFPTAANKGEEAVELFTKDNQLCQDMHGKLNPIHPKVRAAVLRMIAAQRDKFKPFSQFQGVNLTTECELDFHGPENGYDDYTVGLFEKETGVTVPASAGSPTRFSERYGWLKGNAWDKWISWRCDKIREFYADMIKELNAGLPIPDKKIVTRMSLSYTPCPATDEFLKVGAVPDDLGGILRDRGVDLALLGKLPGLVVMPGICPNRSRTNVNFPVDERYFNFSPELAAIFKNDAYPAVLVRQSNLEIYWRIATSKIKSFWWKVGSYAWDNKMTDAFSTPQPDNKYLLENMAWVLAEIDPWMIDHGFWGCPENGALEIYQRFHKAFLSIPRLRFEKASGQSDPVTVRVHDSEQGHWFYVVNKAYYPVNVSFRLGAGNEEISDAVWNQPVKITGGEFSRELRGHEVLVFKCPSPTGVSGLVQMIPATEKERLAATLSEWGRKLALYKKIYGAAHPMAARTLADAKAFFVNNEYIRTEHRLESRALREMAMELTGDLQRSLTTDGGLALRFTNTDTAPVSGELSLVGWPKAWTLEGGVQDFKDLAPGATFTGAFHFAMPGFWHGGAQFDFQTKLELVGKPARLSKFSVHPFLALKGRKPIRVDGDLSDWDKEAVWYKLDRPLDGVEKKPGFKPVSAIYSWLWGEAGLTLAAKVEEDDFLPPDEEGAMYKRDSLQVYFDQLDNKSRAYDGNDLIYQVGLVNGRPMAWREQAPAGQPTGVADKVKVAVKRQGRSTIYEVLFPVSEFTRAKLEAGAMLGFSVMVNNSDNVGPGRELHSCLNVNPHASPYLNPWSWRDLLLAESPPSRLRASLEGSMPLQSKTGNMERMPRLKDKPVQSAKCLLFDSGNLCSEWGEFVFEFVPEADGRVSLSLGGPWMPEGERLPECWTRRVRIDAQAAAFDNWQHYAIPETRRTNGGLEVKVDMSHPYFTQFPVKKGVSVKVSLEAKNVNGER